jgi:two-component system, NarL family, sensor histidine kinase EvgS
MTDSVDQQEGTADKRLKSPCVLLVDDNRLALVLMARNLKELGCSVLSAGNGQEALEILHAEPSVDLVVTDLGMPVMDGLELLRQIRESERLKDLPVILCSGDVDEAMMKKATAYGCVRYLVKPVHPEFLLEQIQTILSHPEGPYLPPQPA